MHLNRFSDEWCSLRASTVLAVVLIALPAIPAIAVEPIPNDVLRVEQDWRVVLEDPESLADSPQFHTVMSPYNHLDSYFAQVVWNYREAPSFTAGGLQLQVWGSDWLMGAKNVREERLSDAAETVTWTQVLETNGEQVSVQVTNGESTTWGTFGGSHTKVSANASVQTLNEYDTGVSVENSWVTLGSNRVQQVEITQVRRYGTNGLISVDSTPKVVFTQE